MLLSIQAGENLESQVQVAQHIQEFKKALSRKHMHNLNAAFVKDVRTLNFKPPKRLDGKESSRLSSQSTSASDDQEQVGPNSSGCHTALDYSCRRVQEVTEHLLQFEERCFVSRLITELQLRSLRSLNRATLERILSHMSRFKHQSSLPIAINILMFNSSKIKIPKDTFKEVIAELFPAAFGGSTGSSIQCIKQSPTYELLKAIIKPHL